MLTRPRRRHVVSPKTIWVFRGLGWRYSSTRAAWVFPALHGRLGPVLRAKDDPYLLVPESDPAAPVRMPPLELTALAETRPDDPEGAEHDASSAAVPPLALPVAAGPRAPLPRRNTGDHHPGLSAPRRAPADEGTRWPFLVPKPTLALVPPPPVEPLANSPFRLPQRFSATRAAAAPEPAPSRTDQLA